MNGTNKDERGRDTYSAGIHRQYSIRGWERGSTTSWLDLWWVSTVVGEKEDDDDDDDDDDDAHIMAWVYVCSKGGMGKIGKERTIETEGDRHIGARHVHRRNPERIRLRVNKKEGSGRGTIIQPKER